MHPNSSNSPQQALEVDDFEDPLAAIADSRLYEDLWDDACMLDVVQYLKGSTDLQVPPEWQRLLPKTIPPTC